MGHGEIKAFCEEQSGASMGGAERASKDGFAQAAEPSHKLPAAAFPSAQRQSTGSGENTS